MPATLGEYRILREVGRGGMGIVYEAEQDSLGRHVALKVLPRRGAWIPAPGALRRGRAAARLHHTNIVPVFGVGESGHHYYAMQFIQGHSLDAVIDEVRRLKAIPARPAERGPVSEVTQALLTGSFCSATDPNGIPPTPLSTLSLSEWSRRAAGTTGIRWCVGHGRRGTGLRRQDRPPGHQAVEPAAGSARGGR